MPRIKFKLKYILRRRNYLLCDTSYVICHESLVSFQIKGRNRFKGFSSGRT